MELPASTQQKRNVVYLLNGGMVTSIIFSTFLMFIVQFRVESLQEEMGKTNDNIASYEDEIQLLEVEWVYLTRPERIRNLATRYLKDNGYILASQIKDSKKLENYYLVNYKKSGEDFGGVKEDTLPSKQVSF